MEPRPDEHAATSVASIQPVSRDEARRLAAAECDACGSGGEPITMDAIEFCRVLSGRAHGTGLLARPVPF